jgi:glycosyltransferase involved in cell wall biosynthesis
MRVLHILDEIRYSGAETMLTSASAFWRGKGVGLSALATAKNEGAYAEVFRKNGFTVFHIPYSLSLKFVFQLFSLMKREKFDVVHIHPERAFFQYAIAAWLARVPVKISTVHHIYAYRSWHVIRPWIYRHICKYVFRVQYVSNSLSGQANEKQLYGLNHVYIPNWFDSRIYNQGAINTNQDNDLRKRMEIADDKILLVSLGGNTEYKNYDKVIEALGTDDLRNRYVYMHLGHDDRHELIPLANKHQVEFKSMGCVKNTIPYLLSADLVMMPSREEGFGIAAVETMAIGVPICLSRRPALIDFKQLTDKLFWCEPTVEGIREFLKGFKKLSEFERITIGEALIAVSERFTIERGANAYLDLYRIS